MLRSLSIVQYTCIWGLCSPLVFLVESAKCVWFFAWDSSATGSGRPRLCFPMPWVSVHCHAAGVLEWGTLCALVWLACAQSKVCPFVLYTCLSSSERSADRVPYCVTSRIDARWVLPSRFRRVAALFDPNFFFCVAGVDCWPVVWGE